MRLASRLEPRERLAIPGDAGPQERLAPPVEAAPVASISNDAALDSHKACVWEGMVAAREPVEPYLSAPRVPCRAKMGV